MLFSTVPQQVVVGIAQTDVLDKPLRDSVYRTFPLRSSEDDSKIRHKYRPIILSHSTAEDWVDSLKLSTALDIAESSLKNGE